MLQLSGQDGGGQILRTALTLSLLTGQPFRLTDIRGARKKPGLQRQHLTCVQAATQISHAATDGAELNSTELLFTPGEVQPGNYHFRIGTAGSTILLAQTLLLALTSANGDSVLTLEGGTHNPLAPSLDFFDRVFRPAIANFGIQFEVELITPGFAPAGGGKIELRIPGNQTLRPYHYPDRGAEKARFFEIFAVNLPDHVAPSQLDLFEKSRLFENHLDQHRVRLFPDSPGSASLVQAEVHFEHASELVTNHGAFGKSSKRVVHGATSALSHFIHSGAQAGPHLADQLLLPIALGGGGSFTTLRETNHLRTNHRTIAAFLPGVDFDVGPIANDLVKVTL